MTDESKDEKPDGQDASGSGENSELTAEEKALAADKKLAKEAANWRTKFREAEKVAQTHAQRVAELEEKLKVGSASNEGATQELAALKRKMVDLEEDNKKRIEKEQLAESRFRTKAIDSKVAEISAIGKLNEPGVIQDLLRSKATIDEDGEPVFVVKTEDGEPVKVEMTLENVKKYKLLPPMFFPSEGVRGTGLRPGQSTGPVTEKGERIDLERAQKDNAYYTKHRAEIMAFRRSQKGQ